MSKLLTTIKRFAAGTIDFIVAACIISIFHFFNSSAGGGTLVVLYTMGLYRYKCTFGGLLFNLKISSLGNREIKGGLSLLRAVLIYSLLEIFSLTLVGNSFALIFICAIITLSAISISFTKKGLMVHDIIARSFVENDEEKKYAKEKSQLLVVFAVLIISTITIRYKESQNNNYCLELFKQKNFQKVIDKCTNKKNTNPNSHLVASLSYMNLQKYNEALREAEMANFLGEKTITPYIICTVNLVLNNFDAILKISEKQIDDPFMLFFSAASYYSKYGTSKNPDYLIKSAAYLKLMTPEVMSKKYDQIAVKEIINYYLSSDSFAKLESSIKLAAQENLSQIQQLEVEKTAIAIKAK